jgi:hypothetical protein
VSTDFDNSTFPQLSLSLPFQTAAYANVWQHGVLRPLCHRRVAGRGMHHGPCIPPGHGLSGAGTGVVVAHVPAVISARVARWNGRRLGCARPRCIVDSVERLTGWRPAEQGDRRRWQPCIPLCDQTKSRVRVPNQADQARLVSTLPSPLAAGLYTR